LKIRSNISGAVSAQQLHDWMVIWKELLRPPERSTATAVVGPIIDICALFDEKFNNFCLSCTGRFMKRFPPIPIRCKQRCGILFGQLFQRKQVTLSCCRMRFALDKGLFFDNICRLLLLYITGK
jgi:hypothetical protein